MRIPPEISVGRRTLDANEDKTGAAPVEIEERAVSLKRGFAYNDASLTKLFTRSKINWAYNWDSKATGLPAGLQFVPMLWGTAADHTNQWNANANAALKSGSGQLLSFNEPDMAAQANLSPAAAATAYKNYMMPFKGKAKLGTPAVTNSGSKNQGLDWLKQFTAACTGCSFDFAAIHWYDTNGNFDYFKQYMTQAYAQTKLPIWITEVCSQVAARYIE